MAEVATGNNTCVVESPDGTGEDCAYPLITSTGQCSSKVFVGGIGVVCEDDKVFPHPKYGCGPDLSGLSTFSSKVFIGGKRVGRKGDYYGNNLITTGNSNVDVGG